MKKSVLSTIALATLVAAPAIGAPAAPAAPTPTPTDAPALVRSVKVKVDSDATLDTVQLYQLAPSRFRLQVTTKKTTSSVEFTSEIDNDQVKPTDVWQGAGTLDGTKGAEIIVARYRASDLKDYEYSVPLVVYTWRSGKLVAEKAPTAAHTQSWTLTGTKTWRGYHFFTRSGHRYVDAMVAASETKMTVTRSVWKHQHWSKTQTKKVRRTDANNDTLYDISGPTIMLSQFFSDLDGDGIADHFTYRRTSPGHYTLAIATSTGKSLTKKIRPAEVVGDPMLGAAHFDGVPGTELAFIVDGEDPEWKVYTWRNGTLVPAQAPSLQGEQPRMIWDDAQEDDTDAVAFSVIDGVATAVSTSSYPDVDNCYLTVTSQWRNGAWVITNNPEGCDPSATEPAHWGLIADFVN